MTENFEILHLSDIHFSSSNKNNICRLLQKLKEDILSLKFTNIKMVCITGDLINSGDIAEKELDMALTFFLQPLMEFLKLSENDIFIVPGNHEIQRNKITPYIESGLQATLKSEEAISNFLEEHEHNSINRISYFSSEFSSMFSGTPIQEDDFSKSYIIKIDDLNIGVSCLNSAWRSTGVGIEEKGKMIIGQNEIIKNYDSVKNTDLKICILHHPLDWLVDCDKLAVEKSINKFDIVLNGHIHELDTKLYTTFNGSTLFNTSGKFDTSSDIYNGYSILSINKYTKECTVFLRQYLPPPRDCFDSALSVLKDGKFSVSLANKENDLSLAYTVSKSIESKFTDYANGYFVSNVAAGKTVRNFEDEFIIPEFNRYSEYEKETEIDDNENQDDSISLDYIRTSKTNILLLGKKEFGKTTLLHYLIKYYLSNFNSLNTVPILINTSYIDFAGKNVILRAAHKFVNDYCNDNQSFPRDSIEKLLISGRCTILFDDFESVTGAKLQKINTFIKKYPHNRFIFAEKEILKSKLQDIMVTPDCEFETVHIHCLTKKQIRDITVNSLSNTANSSIVDKILLCFKKTTLPKTPFVLSLILSLCDTDEFVPINEAVIMEHFMESLLEKTAPSEAYSSTYDFRIKEDFLINIASYMNSNNIFYLSTQDFENILYNYHEEKGFTVSSTKFDRLFFDNGVLVKMDDVITFRYTCMIEYYLAKKATQDPEFLKMIMSDRNYLNYPNELLYFTGLNRRNTEIVHILRSDFKNDILKLNKIVPSLDDYNIGLNFSMPIENFSKELRDSKLTQQESDELQDPNDTSDFKSPEDINRLTKHNEFDSFIGTLLSYGYCLRNLELISRTDKDNIFNDYIAGLCILLGIFKSTTEDFFHDKIKSMKENNEKYNQQDIEKQYELLDDFLKISIPIILQNVALENIGSAKLRNVIVPGIKGDDEFRKFFSVFLYSDLRFTDFKSVLSNYCKSIENKSLLKIVLFKLMYYYRFRYFDSDYDSFFENLLADIYIKLNNSNKYKKSNLIDNIKKQKQLN